MTELDPSLAAERVVMGLRSIAALGLVAILLAGFSTNGWLAVLLMFVLAAVFAEGTRMRDDLEGTV